MELEALKVAVKEKRGRDTMKMWHIRPEFEHLLEEPTENAVEEAGDKAEKTPKANKKGSITDFLVKGSGDETPASGSGSNKRKHSISVDTPSPSPSSFKDKGGSSGGGSEHKKKGKPKTAFQLYVKEHRAEAEASLGSESSDTTALKNRLLQMWRDLKSEDRAVYEKLEVEEKAKAEKSHSSGSSKKKMKR